MTQPVTLRERQAQQVREAVLDAVITHLEARSFDDVSMAEVADSAGISLRTLYRYFPDRESLLRAAGEQLYASLDVPYDIETPEEISVSFQQAARKLTQRPELTRALVRTTAGRTARSAVRGRRATAIRAALAPASQGVDAKTARGAAAVITHLCSAASWVLIADESGLSDLDAQRAVAWAIDCLVAALRQPAQQRVGAKSRS